MTHGKTSALAWTEDYCDAFDDVKRARDYGLISWTLVSLPLKPAIQKT
jgi:hypothetical protein